MAEYFILDLSLRNFVFQNSTDKCLQYLKKEKTIYQSANDFVAFRNGNISKEQWTDFSRSHGSSCLQTGIISINEGVVPEIYRPIVLEHEAWELYLHYAFLGEKSTPFNDSGKNLLKIITTHAHANARVQEYLFAKEKNLLSMYHDFDMNSLHEELALALDDKSNETSDLVIRAICYEMEDRRSLYTLLK
ncbi:MAG: hypothetical protein ABIC91_07580 [Nanoarchaeota archaeon]|nr:hypothetical protein [Nanoarchaeota archaeon]MBU1850265.1 hypothetical protein [Nanoarchaeota archaeon]